MKLVIVLLGLGVCACCAYGMSQIDPQLIPKGLNVITDLKVIPIHDTSNDRRPCTSVQVVPTA